MSTGGRIASEQPSFFHEYSIGDTQLLNHFRLLLPDELFRRIHTSPKSQCMNDFMPAWLLEKCLPELLPWLLHVVNSSPSTGRFPAAWKLAIVKPLFKKPSLDSNSLSSYRPVSQLPFLSKVLERVVLTQLKNYLAGNDFYNRYQSACREHHSTETLLLRVHDDLLRSLDSGDCVALLLLDLSSAFDTVDHTR